MKIRGELRDIRNRSISSLHMFPAHSSFASDKLTTGFEACRCSVQKPILLLQVSNLMKGHREIDISSVKKRNKSTYIDQAVKGEHVVAVRAACEYGISVPGARFVVDLLGVELI